MVVKIRKNRNDRKCRLVVDMVSDYNGQSIARTFLQQEGIDCVKQCRIPYDECELLYLQRTPIQSGTQQQDFRADLLKWLSVAVDVHPRVDELGLRAPFVLCRGRDSETENRETLIWRYSQSRETKIHSVGRSGCSYVS